MGNTFASQNSVYIHLDNNVFFGGGLISGSVFVNAIRPVQIQGLHFQITGAEECSWEETEQRRSNNDTDASTIYHRGKSTILQLTVPVLGPGMLQPGHYQFPIKCQLPTQLPGTFNYQDATVRAQIEYKVHAELTIPGMLGLSNTSYSLPIQVLQPVNSMPQQIHKEHFEFINLCCCIPKGHIQAVLVLPSNTATPGTPFNFHVHVNNNSRVAVTIIDAYVDQHLRLCSSSGWPDAAVNLTGQRTQLLLHANGETIKEHNPRLATQRFHSEQGRWTSVPGGPPLKLELSVMIPHNAQGTRVGTVLSNSFTITLLLRTPVGYTNMKLNLPIVMNDVQPTVMGVPMPSAPPGWSQPTVYPTFQFMAAPGAPVPPPLQYTPSAPPLPVTAVGVPAAASSSEGASAAGDEPLKPTKKADMLLD